MTKNQICFKYIYKDKINSQFPIYQKIENFEYKN